MPDITSQDLLHQIKITGKIPELLNGILQRQVLEDTAAELKLEISGDELQVGADQFRATNKLETIPATQKWLADRMLSVDDFEQLVTTNLLAPKVAQCLFANKAAPYFHQNTLDYGRMLDTPHFVSIDHDVTWSRVGNQTIVIVAENLVHIDSLQKEFSPGENPTMAISHLVSIVAMNHNVSKGSKSFFGQRCVLFEVFRVGRKAIERDICPLIRCTQKLHI